MEEKNLIELCLRNDRRAQKELVQKFAPVLLTVARRYTYSVIQPEDILQDSFVSIFTNLHQFDSHKGQLIHWMRQIVINTALKHFRSVKRELNGHSSLETIQDHDHVIQAESLDQFDAEHWLFLIQRLPQMYRQVFNLAAVDGYSHEEISKLLGIEIVTSRSCLHRARKILFAMIEQEKLVGHGSE